jgi:predicted dehydrogenase
MKRLLLITFALLTANASVHSQEAKAPVRFAIVGLEHDHAAGFIPRAKDRKDIQLVGIIEARADLISRYARRYELNPDLFYPTLDALLAKTNIQAVATFTSTFDHRKVVEMCAPKGIHVMMEKPLAVSIAWTMRAPSKRRPKKGASR